MAILQAIALVANPVRLGHLDVGHEDRADIAGADAEPVFDRLGAQRLAAGCPIEL